MYKKQMMIQRILCFAALASAALMFVYSLGLMTDMYDCFFSTIRRATQLDKSTVTGSRIYYDMQEFNRNLTIVGIALIVISLILFITCTHSRRKYYIGNYVAVGITSVCNIAASVWTMGEIAAYREVYLNVNFDELKAHAEKRNTLYTDSTFWFDAGFVVCAVLLVVTALLIANVALKIIVMKEEKRMIGSRKDVRA